jgi:CHASE3 domain sensor protein
VWQAVKDLQKADKDLTAKVAEIEVLVAGHYVKRDDLDQLSKAIFAKLDRIEDKLDGKVDK